MRTLFMTKANRGTLGKKFLINDSKSIGYLCEEKMKLDSYLKLYTKVNSQWIMAVNMEGKSIKFLEESKRFSS